GHVPKIRFPVELHDLRSSTGTCDRRWYRTDRNRGRIRPIHIEGESAERIRESSRRAGQPGHCFEVRKITGAKSIKKSVVGSRVDLPGRWIVRERLVKVPDPVRVQLLVSVGGMRERSELSFVHCCVLADLLGINQSMMVILRNYLRGLGFTSVGAQEGFHANCSRRHTDRRHATDTSEKFTPTVVFLISRLCLVRLCVGLF